MGTSIVPEGVRRAGGWVAVAIAAYLAVVVALSLDTDGVVARTGMALVVPGFVAVFPLFGLTVVDAVTRTRGQPLVGHPLPLRGWRPWALVPIVAVGAAAFFLPTDLPSGQPVRDGDRYLLDSHGERTEVTRAEWLEANAAWSRGFAGIALVLTGLAALWLTQPPEEDEPVAVPLPGELGRVDRLAGARAVEVRTPRPPAEVVALVDEVASVSATTDRPDGGLDVLGTWPLAASRVDRAQLLTLDLAVAADGRGSHLTGTIAPLGRGALAMGAASVVGGLVAVGLAASFLPGGELGAGGLVLFAAWVGWAGFVMYRNVSSGARTTRLAAERLASAVA